MSEKAVVISERFAGPPDSANGGYACGLIASALLAESAEVTLRLPPPIGVPMRLEASPDGSALYEQDRLVADARPIDIEIEVPEPAPFEQIEAAARDFEVESYENIHPFPNCFVCGPRRVDGDGLRIFPGPIGRMHAGVHRRPGPGEPLIAAGWMISKNGRKRISGSAIWSRDGEVLARAVASWIALTPDQLRTFGVVGSTR